MKRLLTFLLALLLCAPALAETDMMSGWNLPEGTTCDMSAAQEGSIRLMIPMEDRTLPVTVICEDDGMWRVTELWFSYG